MWTRGGMRKFQNSANLCRSPDKIQNCQFVRHSEVNVTISFHFFDQVCKPVTKEVCEKIHKNKPHQHECQVCGGVEKECKRLDNVYYN